jgi:hypothetical protein
MADPATIIAVAGLAWSSSKALYDFIEGLANAPTMIKEVKEDLTELEKILKSLEALLKDGNSVVLATIFERVGIKSALEACSAVCNNFKATLSKYTKHSTTDSFSKRDRLTVQFFKSKIVAFKLRLNASKGTVEFAVNSATLYAKPMFKSLTVTAFC